MNGTGARQIDIFAPFNEALELTKRILFQPFDLTKWLVIGFAAFLSHFAGGGAHFNFRTAPWKHGNWQWNFRSWGDDYYQTSSNLSGCWIPVLIIGVFLAIAIGIVLFWIGSRGKFIFTDCIVRNRAAIAEPWREFRREGNSYFIFSLLVGLALVIVFGLATIPLWIPLLARGETPQGPGFVITIIGLSCVFFVAAVFLAIATSFMVPIMYRRRCGAVAAFQAAVSMIAEEPGPVILYILFLIVLWVAFAMISCLTSCITCCITALPYVGTVILLPFYVFLASFVLLFVRQFGPDYDPWANLAAGPAAVLEVPPSTPPPSPPPITTEPPPPPPIQP